MLLAIMNHTHSIIASGENDFFAGKRICRW